MSIFLRPPWQTSVKTVQLAEKVFVFLWFSCSKFNRRVKDAEYLEWRWWNSVKRPPQRSCLANTHGCTWKMTIMKKTMKPRGWWKWIAAVDFCGCRLDIPAVVLIFFFGNGHYTQVKIGYRVLWRCWWRWWWLLMWFYVFLLAKKQKKSNNKIEIMLTRPWSYSNNWQSGSQNHCHAERDIPAIRKCTKKQTHFFSKYIFCFLSVIISF